MSIKSDNVLYHNVEYMENNFLGKTMYRYPLDVVKHINERARFMAQYACGCEIRFVTEAKRIHINVSAQGTGVILAVIFKGDYVHDVLQIKSGRVTTIEIVDANIPKSAKDIFFEGNNFSPDVWRVHFHNCICTISSINAMGYEIRAPYASEMPKQTMLAYGSSITHGARAVTHTNSYADEAARILGVDILNKGVGGSCQFEPEIADFFAKDSSWDFAWIEGAINSTGMSSEEFEKRFSYFIDTLHKTGKKLFMTTILPTTALLDNKSIHYEKVCEFNEIIRSKTNIGVIVEGSEIITDLRFLTTDLIHPSNEGHTRMGINLANILSKYL